MREVEELLPLLLLQMARCYVPRGGTCALLFACVAWERAGKKEG